MQSFPERLNAARRAKNMTQEQLAEAMNVSRPMISHWENGRAQPDLASMKGLSEVLGYDFFQDVEVDTPREVEPVTQPPEAPATTTEPSSPAPIHPTSPRKKWRWGYLYAFLAGIALTVFVVFFLVPFLEDWQYDSTKEPIGVIRDIPNRETIPSIEWFKQASLPVEGQAFVNITANEDPVRPIRSHDFQDGVGWFYTVYLTEEHGIDFYVEEVTMTFFITEARADVYRYTEVDLESFWGDNIIPANGQQEWGGGLKYQQTPGFGFTVTGKDANGKYLEFHNFIEFSQEIAD